MKNRELFHKDPMTTTLLNNGVAVVADPRTPEEWATLRFELETFVCEGEYQRGLDRILGSYLANLSKPEQPAVWVSGFYGSGKSHLVKMLRYLWVDYAFPDKATAGGLAHLPTGIADHLKELSTQGKRYGGLHAVSGTLGAGGGNSVRLTLLSMIFRSAGLPEEYRQARFVLWLKANGLYEKVRGHVEKAGREFAAELRNLLVSTHIAQALLAADPKFASGPAEVHALLKAQYPPIQDVSNSEMVQCVRDAIGPQGKLPCTLVVLDEAQQWIGENAERSHQFQMVTEECSKGVGSQLLFVATGQSALTGTPQLQKLSDRFRVRVQLSDTDVEAVTRKMVLAKKPDKEPALRALLTQCSGETSRHLVGTKIGPRTEDDAILTTDYPILPVRRRFWEKVLRAVDTAGTASQLRTQLRIVYEAARAYAEKPVGTVIPADFIYDQKATEMIQTAVLLPEIYELIKKQRDGTPDGDLRSRLCALVFLIGQLSREAGSDTGIRATKDTLADLLVEDLPAGSAALRQQTSTLLDKLVEDTTLLLADDEYHIQTRIWREWKREFENRLNKVKGDAARIESERADVFRRECSKLLQPIKLTHGKPKVPRKIEPSFEPVMPQPTGQAIPVWVRDEWSVDMGLKSVLADARAAGVDNPVVHVFLPKRSADELRKAIASQEAAEEVIQVKGDPSTKEGKEARKAMQTLFGNAQQSVRELVGGILQGARVFLGGGTEVNAIGLQALVEEGARSALARLFHRFDDADLQGWDTVLTRARKGDGSALEAVGYKGDPEKHAVTSEVLRALGNWTAGREVRKTFEGPPYGWPRDAVDGTLVVLCATDHVRARQDDQPVRPAELDQHRIGVAEFKSETVFIGANQRRGLRTLFQAVGVAYKLGEEATAAPGFIQEMLRRAEAAGGDSPCPERPNTAHLKEAASLSGNDQLARLFELRDRLAAEAGQWQKTGERIAQRIGRWDALTRLLAHATGMPQAAEVAPQAEAIRANRSLLADPEPVPPLCDALTTALREALLAARDSFVQTRDRELAALQADPNWPKASPDQRSALLAAEGLDQAPDVAVGTEAELLGSLDAIPLDAWRTRTDALPARFHKVRLRLAQLFEPKLVHITLTQATLHNEADVDAWLGDAKKRIMTDLQNPGVSGVMV